MLQKGDKMTNRIELKDIQIKDNKSKYELIFKISINGELYNLKYKIQFIGEKINYRFEKRFDSTVVTFLLFSMVNGYDFYSDYPISETLYYNLIYHIIPQIKRCNPETKSISINAPLTKEKADSKYVATGISCGIDSLTTIYEYSKLCELDNYKLTHLVYFKTGAHDGQLGRFDKDVENNLFTSQLKNAKKFCDESNFPLIIVDSNLNEILSDSFGFTSYERTHTLRNCGTMLLFLNVFSKYYYSDTYSLDEFELNIYNDIAHYEKWMLPLLSTENINFYSANKSMSRFEKTELLTSYELSFNNLLVCWYEGENCGRCDKCIRTLVTLDLIGKLAFYKNSFDIDNYKKNRKKYITRVIALRKVDSFYNDIYIHMDRKTKIFISPVYFIVYKFEALMKKLREE